MQRYIPFFEKRSNPELNPYIGAWDYLDKYKDDPDVYISFTEIDKIGINPESKYNTPVGIYTYPLKEFVRNYIDKEDGFELRKDIPVGHYAPFAGSSKYINFIRVKDKAHFINDMYKDYGSDNYDRDIKILTKIYKPIFKSVKNKNILIKDWGSLIDVATRQAYQANPSCIMWNITREISGHFSANEKQASTKWNLILSKDLGYSGFADKSGKGYIHPSEPMQAVFLNTRAFEVIARVENVPAKKVVSDEENKKLKIAGLLNKSLNLGLNLQHLIKAIYFNGNKLELNFLNLWDDRIMIQGPQVKALSIPIHKIICGCLYISHTNLTSLKNIPVTIEGSLCITGNEKLTVLDYLPELVTNDLILDKRYKTKYGYTEDSIRELCNVNGNIRFL